MARHSAEPTGSAPAVAPGLRDRVLGRRKFLTYLVAGSTLTVAAKVGFDTLAPGTASALVPSPPQPADVTDLGDILIMAGKPTEGLLIQLEIQEDGNVRVELPRMEVGQGLTTSVAMLVAEELDVPLSAVYMPLAPARPELLFNQLTGGSNSIRSLFGPVRAAAAVARGRLLAAASEQLRVPVGDLQLADGVVVGPSDVRAAIGTLTGAAAALPLGELTAAPKKPSDYKLVGSPVSRVDARAMVTGEFKYTLDLDIPDATPAMVRRPPTINGTVDSVNNEKDVRSMPGVIDVVVIPSGVAVVAETFGQALDAKDALDVTWKKGTVDGLSDAEIKEQLRGAALPFAVPAAGELTIDAEFDFAFASHAPMETNSAVADVRPDGAEIWSGLKSPIVAQQAIAKEIGLPENLVKVNVVQSGGSFGRRLFFDGALEAAQISKATGRVIKLMWTRVDDMRHGRARAGSFHRVRVTHAADHVLSFEHRVASVETDTKHGLGEILTATAASLPVGGNMSFAQTMFLTTVKCPYNFGAVTQVLNEIPLDMHTGSWRSVYSANTRGAEEIIVDEIAAKLGRDPVEFRLEALKEDRYRAVLEKVADEGGWGAKMDKGFAQGVAFHAEYKSCTACLVEIDARDPQDPRVTKAVIAGDFGLPINPRGLESQLLGGLTDAISTTLRAGLHIEDGLPLEGSYSQFHYARQADSPTDVKIFIMPANDKGDPGGAGELGVPAAVGAIGNAYARATGIAPRSFPINFPVDFDPFPR
ncbi:molybdopterin cofactor-binding domain-containing protein [Pseudonocardia bannensis]|uniref:Xanthine dehydrogenase family protein molybdopterin-binding subunit n=1 Tax=Pseudonocardia bannensis TaxID=630973 RepID=A0A848DN37_9PSEU|nr:molybdopterin cofactor-binding domain-containing protein [Pseudonocardia bannensis]NMH93841.1 xanthine dehydrogenase family protein molybdopterin-binding subunit [Pseudonocardia bannensis]